MRHRFVMTGAMVLAAVVAWIACGSPYGEDSRAVGDGQAPLPDARDDAGDASDADPCTHARWPAAPKADDGTAPDVDLLMALSELHIDPSVDGGGGASLSFDLDGVCTCPGPGSCIGPRADVCDDPSGRDDSAGNVLTAFSQNGELLDDGTLNARLRAGRFGLLVGVRQYNGGQNDRQVTVSVILTHGIDGPAVDGGPPAPKFDGTDRWLAEAESLIGGSGVAGTDCTADNTCVPLYVDANAYVAGGVVVATMEFPVFIQTADGPLLMDLRSNQLVARIVPDAPRASYRLDDGRIVARWPAGKLLQSLAPIGDPIAGGNLCGQDLTYQGAKQIVCNALDIMSDLRQDNAGLHCNALSIALAFRASAAQLGHVATRPAIAQPCGASWTDTCDVGPDL